MVQVGTEETHVARHLVPSLGRSLIVAVAAGRDHSAAVSGSGRLYVWGMNTHGT